MCDSLFNPITVTLCFSLILLALNFFNPRAGRIVTCVFFVLMACVNFTVLLINPGLIAEAGSRAFLPVYRWFFSEVLARYPVPLLIALIAFEASVGALILSKGRWVRCGVFAAIAFCLWLMPVGIEEISTPVLALAIGLLLRHKFDRSLVEMIGAALKPRAAAAGQG